MEIYTRTFKTITVNGRTYSSVDEMPPDVREQFEKAMSLFADKNNNGIPDALEGAGAAGSAPGTVVTHTSGVTTRLGATTTSSSPPRPILQASWTSSREGGGRITLSWPTLLALLATVAVVGGAIVWYARTGFGHG